MVTDHQFLHEPAGGAGGAGRQAQGVRLQHLLLPQGHGSRSRLSQALDQTGGHFLQRLHTDSCSPGNALVSGCKYFSLYRCLAVSISAHTGVWL